MRARELGPRKPVHACGRENASYDGEQQARLGSGAGLHTRTLSFVDATVFPGIIRSRGAVLVPERGCWDGQEDPDSYSYEGETGWALRPAVLGTEYYGICLRSVSRGWSHEGRTTEYPKIKKSLSAISVSINRYHTGL